MQHIPCRRDAPWCTDASLIHLCAMPGQIELTSSCSLLHSSVPAGRTGSTMYLPCQGTNQFCRSFQHHLMHALSRAPETCAAADVQSGVLSACIGGCGSALALSHTLVCMLPQGRAVDDIQDHVRRQSQHLQSAVESCTRTATSGASLVPNSASTALGSRTALALHATQHISICCWACPWTAAHCSGARQKL